jgi:Domain of unknown function (DUF6265)
MLHRIRPILCGLLLAAGGAAHADPCRSLADLRWLLGGWRAASDDRIVTETWREASPGTFEGRGETRRRGSDTILDGEDLRLVAMSEAVFYVAKVAHNDYPVAFRLTQCGPGRLVFENPGHDFPRRLEYTRQADGGLEVVVSDGGTRGFTLRFAPDGA